MILKALEFFFDASIDYGKEINVIFDKYLQDLTFE